MCPPNAYAVAEQDTAVRRSTHLSRYARRLLTAQPELLPPESISQPFTAEDMRERLAGAASDEALMHALRDLRKRVMLRIIARDLGGLATLEEVMSTITSLADIAISTAVEHLQREFSGRYGEPIGEESGDVQTLHVIGMGKLGGNELNVSSDIDLVFAYPEDGETRGARPLSNHEFFIRFSRRLIIFFPNSSPWKPYTSFGSFRTDFNITESVSLLFTPAISFFHCASSSAVR